MNNIFVLCGIPLVLGFLIDLLLGDPYFLPHPIRLIGNMISKGELLVRKLLPKTKQGEIIGGTSLAVAISIVCFLTPTMILFLAWKLHVIIYLIVATIMSYQILAVKSLKTESMKVYKELALENVEEARQAVSMIVGRDTSDLTKEGIIKATVETIAENTSDGTVAPMLFMAIGGAPLGFFYKAVNTMDSMIGYKNEKYLYFGKFAARFDDVLNFIPARLSGAFMIIATFFLGLDVRGSMRIFARDRLNHASPNSAQTEAVCAGALNIQLGGDGWYFGKLYKKKTIGDKLRGVKAEDILMANRLLYGTAWITIVFCMIGMVTVEWII